MTTSTSTPLRWADPKDPAEILTYHLDATQALEGDTIANAVWSITPAIGLAIKDSVFTDQIASITFDDESTAGRYECAATLDTAAGDRLHRTCILYVRPL